MVHIITDTTACLAPEIARRYQIPIIPQIIHFGEETYYEGVDMSIETFMQRLKTDRILPKTAAPPPELFAEEFEQLVPAGKPILCIHPSTEVSGTVHSAQVAALDFPGADFRIIDSRVIASPLGCMVERAAEWAAAGESADCIVDRLVDLIRRCRVYFLVDSLDFLVRGGRIGGASALVGGILQIKPILTVKDGKVFPYEKARTHRRAVDRLKELVVDQISSGSDGMLTVLHADRPEEGTSLAESLRDYTSQSTVPVVHMPPAIVTHGGPGILGVGFFTNGQSAAA